MSILEVCTKPVNLESSDTMYTDKEILQPSTLAYTAMEIRFHSRSDVVKIPNHGRYTQTELLCSS